MVRKQALLVILAVTLFGLLGGVIVTLLQPVRYQAEAYVIVYAMPSGFTELLSPDAAGQLDSVYQAGALQDAVLKQVRKRLPQYSDADIRRAVQVEIIAYTPLTRITATATTPDGAAALANAVADYWTAVAGAANARAYYVTSETLAARENDLIQKIAAIRSASAGASSTATDGELQTLQDALSKTETAILDLDEERYAVAGDAEVNIYAQAADAERIPDPAKNLGIGAVIGFALGFVLALWLTARYWRSHRQEPEGQPRAQMLAPAPAVFEASHEQ